MQIGRDDLKIVSPYWLEASWQWRGKFLNIVVDHAVHLSIGQYQGLMSVRDQYERHTHDNPKR